LKYWKYIIIYNSENYEFIDTTREGYNNNVIGVIEYKMEIIIIYGDDGLIKIFSLENWKKNFHWFFIFIQTQL
jgi:hypothetical protein